MAEEYKISVKELTNPLRISAKSCEMTRHTTWAMLMNSAADAIEQLNANYEQAMKYAKMWEAIANGTKELLQKEHDKVPKWIPVTERLPDKYDDVIFHYERTGISGAKYRETDVTTLTEVTRYYKPLYWMPLPNPPEKGREE